MSRTVDGVPEYAPLYIHTFRVVRSAKTDRFLKEAGEYAEIDTVQDRMRWCRVKLGLTQKELAEQLGISRSMYINMETGAIDQYPLDVLDKLSKLYNVPITDFLDEYNLFLYCGQGAQLRAYRDELGMTQKDFAAHMGVYLSNITLWEKERKVISKTLWKRYFEERLDGTPKENIIQAGERGTA